MSDQWLVKAPPGRATPRPAYKWHMDFFGDGSLNFQFQNDKNWWARIWCTMFFGTKWKKL
jgi:hypothetical protein